MYTQQQTQQAIRVNQIAKEIYRQIKATFNLNVIWSWGIAEQRAMIFRDMPSLGLRVNGFNHKGWVIISLHEGKDLYHICLLDRYMNEIQIVEDVFCDDLEILDTLIETGKMSKEEYAEAVNSTYQTNY
jgi:hypothetical protein